MQACSHRCIWSRDPSARKFLTLTPTIQRPRPPQLQWQKQQWKIEGPASTSTEWEMQRERGRGECTVLLHFLLHVFDSTQPLFLTMSACVNLPCSASRPEVDGKHRGDVCFPQFFSSWVGGVMTLFLGSCSIYLLTHCNLHLLPDWQLSAHFFTPVFTLAFCSLPSVTRTHSHKPFSQLSQKALLWWDS